MAELFLCLSGWLLFFVYSCTREIRKSNEISFRTTNNGRTFWYEGKEMRPSKLTDQLQDAWKMQNACLSSKKLGWGKDDFYND